MHVVNEAPGGGPGSALDTADVTATNATVEATENEGNLNGIRLEAPNSARGK